MNLKQRRIELYVLVVLCFALSCVLFPLIRSAQAQSYSRSVISFTLINADTEQPIPGFTQLSDGVTLDIAKLPTRNLNIVANTSPETVGSVRFELDGNSSYRIESVAPYALAGDWEGDYNGWTPELGSHQLTATPYSDAGGSGTPGAALILQFNVTDSSSAPPDGPQDGPGEVTGELKQWHRVTVTFNGPDTSESANVNPFLDYRLDVTFTGPSGRSWKVPGHYAADGNAAESGASGGSKWRVHFTPAEVGEWVYRASFRYGDNVAVSLDANAGSPAFFDGTGGRFQVAATDKGGRDFRGKGRLRHVGGHYLRHEGTREHFLKGGADSPENFLAYYEFDQTPASHYYWPHAGDWQPGDPTWRGGRGKNIIGALNYLSGKGMNSVYFLTMNVAGDGRDVWPWTSSEERYRFDISKLDQWEIVFSHMDRLGLMLHVVTQEIENDHLLNGGELGRQRRLYYRELISRFGHHLGVTWNLGEENRNTDEQRRNFIQYIGQVDPYQHFLVVHTWPGEQDSVYTPLLGHPNFGGTALQMYDVNDAHAETLKWVNLSAQYGRKWVVTLDEIGPSYNGVAPDAVDPEHAAVRKQGLWGNLMAGGAGAEWYFGYDHPNHDLNCEDWRSRDRMWDQTRYALEFFHTYIPFAEMMPADELARGAYVLAKPGEVYAVYLPNGGTANLDLGASRERFTVKWYNPRVGGGLQDGTVQTITGRGKKSIGHAPFGDDSVALIQRETNVEPEGAIP